MPLDQSEAIILETFHVGDQDKIVVFFTRQRGILKGVAKGARKFGNRFGSSLEPMSLVNIFFYEKERRDLVTISNCEIIESFFDIQRDPKITFIFSYFAELVESFLPSRAKEELLYRLLLSVIRAFKEKSEAPFLTRYFEAWLLKISGVLPDFSRCRKCRRKVQASSWLSVKKDGVFCENCAPQKKEEVKPEVHRFLTWIKKNPPLPGENVPFTGEQLNTIRKTLQEIIIFHLEGEPKTLRFLR